MEPKGTSMKLDWSKDPESANRYTAESFQYRYVMLAPKRGRVYLRVHYFHDDPVLSKPIDEKPCVSRRSAERIAQRFEDRRGTARRLR
jgi:hypothetical protein